MASIVHNTKTDSLADILERVLDKGIVIAGDIKVRIADVELLTIQVRLLIASVDKAKEMGIDFWSTNPEFSSRALERGPGVAELSRRVEELEAALAGRSAEALEVPGSPVRSP